MQTQPAPRSPSELFALSARAREAPEPREGAIGAHGFGFVVARQLETELYGADGGTLEDLPRPGDVELALGSALTLTQGWLRVGDHVEELFRAALFVVTPEGGQDMLSVYAGPSGLALGDGRQLEGQKLLPRPPITRRAIDRALAVPRQVAAALCEALFAVPPTDFVLRAGSDFGEHTLGVIDGRPIRGGRGLPALAPWRFPVTDPTDWDAALDAARRADRGSLGALADLVFAYTSLTPAMAEDRSSTYHAVAGALWPAALDALERALASVGDGCALPGVLDVIAPTLACPPTAQITDSRAGWRAGELWSRVREVQDRRYAAHPIRSGRS